MNVKFKYLIANVLRDSGNLIYLQKYRVESEWGSICEAMTFDSFEEAMKWIMEYGSVYLGLDRGFCLVHTTEYALNKVTGKSFDNEMFMKLHDPLYMLI